MQQTTTIQMSRGRRGMAAISTISLVVALVALWAVERQDLPTTPAPVATRVQMAPFTSPRFADEAAYVPTVQEYLNPAIGEEYLPVASPVVARRASAPINPRILSDELADSMDTYLQAGAALDVPDALTPMAGPR
jgi:hypothetical protein